MANCVHCWIFMCFSNSREFHFMVKWREKSTVHFRLNLHFQDRFVQKLEAVKIHIRTKEFVLIIMLRWFYFELQEWWVAGLGIQNTVNCRSWPNGHLWRLSFFSSGNMTRQLSRQTPNRQDLSTKKKLFLLLFLLFYFFFFFFFQFLPPVVQNMSSGGYLL